MKLAVGTAAPVKFSQIRPTAVLPLAARPMASNMLRHRPLGQADPASKQLDGVAVRAFAKDKDSLLYRIHGLTHSHGGALRGVPLLLGVPLVLLAAQLELIQLNPSAFWGFYMMSLEVYPFTTKLCTGVVGALLGDFLAQVLPVITARVKGTADSAQTAAGWSYDYLRAGRFALFSAVVGTPVAHLWFTFLDTVLPGTAMHTVASKVAMDQLLLCPIMTALFFAAMCALEGRAHKAVDEVRSKLVPTLKANYALWPAAHVINFAFIPSDLRILYVNVVALLWTVFLSSMAAGSVPSQQQQREAPSTGRAATPALTDLAPAPVAMPEVVKVPVAMPEVAKVTKME